MPNSPLDNRRRNRIAIGLGVIFAGAALTLARPIQNEVEIYAILHSEAANAEAIASIIHHESNPSALIWKIWETRKIPQRQMVLEYLRSEPRAMRAACEGNLPLLEAAALDADANVRELALGLLQSQKSPGLLDLARAQLQDADPNIRILGLHYLRNAGDERLAPEVIRMMNDPEPVVAASADSVLRQWTTNDFGLRLGSLLGTGEGNSNAKLTADQMDSIHKVADEWNAWLKEHQESFRAALKIAVQYPARETRPVAGDFSLPDIEGHLVRLSDFKGKTVWLNFWTTWCTACQEEIPSLVELQKRHPVDLVILSVSLDGATVDDDEWEAQQITNHSPVDDGPAEIHQKIRRIIKARGINYPILLDPKDKIGARFNGHELPTNVIIGPDGVVQRRFIGARSMKALEAMLREAAFSEPASSVKVEDREANRIGTSGG